LYPELGQRWHSWFRLVPVPPPEEYTRHSTQEQEEEHSDRPTSWIPHSSALKAYGFLF
jgi:hypothetical protein